MTAPLPPDTACNVPRNQPVQPEQVHTQLCQHKAAVLCLCHFSFSPHDNRGSGGGAGAHKPVISDGMFMDKQPPSRWVATQPSWGLLDFAGGVSGTSCEGPQCGSVLRAVNTSARTSPGAVDQHEEHRKLNQEVYTGMAVTSCD